MNPAGRGVFYWSDEERTITAPRAALRVAGVNVPRDKLVCHHCDNKSCVNPRHLYVGDYSSNITDAWDRGQRSKNSNIRGSRHGMAKLDEDGVRRIRALAAEGVRQNQIAAELGIGTTTVNNVILRRTWKHV